ncbi:LysR family transcriptional regulator [Pectinatus frisingensis]|jgi:DNA-binding transcriptional LysR family regulator|uniref:LysR family transcriptional regulator n=1 Tax=Pectinatus frisingensis TaxID=865 RepID=UPI0015F5FA77|nr:LysR family transcriptional regulator [Pectinatus frisingensis]
MQQEMNYIYEVYKMGSFSKAAANLYLSQPALSISVKKVEKEIGMPIFDRSQQPLKLTEAGKIYIQKIIDIKLLENDLENELQDIAKLSVGKLRLGGTQYFNSYVMPIVIKKYMYYYPKIELSLFEDNSGLLDTKLADGSVDIMFHCGSFDKKSFMGTDIFEDRLLLAVPEELLTDKKTANKGLTANQVKKDILFTKDCPYVPLSAFADIPFLILTESNNLHERSLAICTGAGFIPKVRFYVEQLETAYHLAYNGLGATFISDLMIKKAPRDNMLYYKIIEPEAIRHFQAVIRRKGYTSFAMQTFIKLTKSIWVNRLSCLHVQKEH